MKKRVLKKALSELHGELSYIKRQLEELKAAIALPDEILISAMDPTIPNKDRD